MLHVTMLRITLGLSCAVESIKTDIGEKPDAAQSFSACMKMIG